MIQSFGTEGGDAVAQKLQIRLFLPAAPYHSQMGEVQLVRQKSERFLRMKILKVKAIRRCGIGTDK